MEIPDEAQPEMEISWIYFTLDFGYTKSRTNVLIDGFEINLHTKLTSAGNRRRTLDISEFLTKGNQTWASNVSV